MFGRYDLCIEHTLLHRFSLERLVINLLVISSMIIHFFFPIEEIIRNFVSTSPHFVDGKWGQLSTFFMGTNPVGTSSEGPTISININNI
jgi:hypothetical protein